MLLKRLFDHTDPKKPRCSGVQVMRGGEYQKFSTRLVERAVKEGWLTLGGGKVTLASDPPTVYAIERAPGYYCCHCKVPLDSQKDAQLHVAKEHAGKESPDLSNPAGYERIHAYECKRAPAPKAKG